MLASAGLLLTVAGLLLIVGIGRAQIAAAQGSSGNLYADPCFDIGLFIGGCGLFWGLAAIASIGSQSKSRREFPDVLIKVVGTGIGPTRAQPGVTYSAPRQSRMIALRITNREASRIASFDVHLKGDLTKGSFGEETELSIPPLWQDNPSGAFTESPVAQARLPIHVPPQTTFQGFMVFDFLNADEHLAKDPCIEIVDHNCGKTILLPVKAGESFGDQPL
jgi:hypothetical protein